MRTLSVLVLAIALAVPGLAKKNTSPHAVANHPAQLGFKHATQKKAKQKAPKVPKHVATKKPKK